MDKIVYISPKHIAGINSLAKFGNSKAFLELLEPVDYHFMLFSTLYQSGANFFQVHRPFLPNEILKNPFWNEKFIDIEIKAFNESNSKAEKILKANFDFELDKSYRAPQSYYLQDYLTSLFYSSTCGIPFVNTDFVEEKDFELIESRLSKELYLALKNLNSQITLDNVSTITPQYSALKKDVTRFQDICCSSEYRNYNISLNNLNDVSRLEMVKKDIHVSALKVFNKFGGNIDLKKMTFSFIKSNKKIADLFLNKPTSIIGDFIVELIEKRFESRNRIEFYKVDQAHHMLLWANRVGELMQKGGRESLQAFLDEVNKNNR